MCWPCGRARAAPLRKKRRRPAEQQPTGRRKPSGGTWCCSGLHLPLENRPWPAGISGPSAKNRREAAVAGQARVLEGARSANVVGCIGPPRLVWLTLVKLGLLECV